MISEAVQLALITGLATGVPATLMALAALRQGQRNHIAIGKVKEQTDGINSRLQGKLNESQDEVAGLKSTLDHIDERKATR